MVCFFISNENIYASASNNQYEFLNNSDSLKEITVNNILISGNDRTKEKIILRELAIEKGSVYDNYSLDNNLKISETNLLKLPLFNYVTIEKVYLTDKLVDIYIIVEERWFTWPEIAIINNERNFNSWWKTKDLSKLDYRFSIKQYNVLGLNHIFKLGVSLGFTREFWLNYSNIFLDKKQQHYLGIYTSIFYQKQAFYRTYQNKIQTFTSSDKNALEGKELEIYYTYRPGFNNKHRLSIAYREQIADDSLVSLNNDYFGEAQSRLSYLELSYRFTHDNRNNSGYPTRGSWLKTELMQQGLGLKESNGLNIFSIYSIYKKYYQIAGKFYGANSISVKKSFNDYEVYYLKKGLGYKDYIRGYEYYVIDGQDYFLIKNNLKYNLLPANIVHFDFIPIKKFRKIHFAIYLNAHFDIAYVNDKYHHINYMNNFSNNLQYSGGIGIDLATYYDRVFRLEYSVMKTGETGMFVHFMAPI
ncbi:MAG: POTRA domain-containing protein [Bacteroidota bacterium]